MFFFPSLSPLVLWFKDLNSNVSFLCLIYNSSFGIVFKGLSLITGGCVRWWAGGGIGKAYHKTCGLQSS